MSRGRWCLRAPRCGRPARAGTHTPVPTHMHQPARTPQPLQTHTSAHICQHLHTHQATSHHVPCTPQPLRLLSPIPAAPQDPQIPITVRPRDRDRPTLLCSTTTLCAAALSHVSMALQMLQIFSSAGVCRSGHPKSSTWVVEGTARGHIHDGLCPLCSPQPAGVQSPRHVPGGGGAPLHCPDVPLPAFPPTLHPTVQTPTLGGPLQSQISAPLWVTWLSCPGLPHVHRDGDDALGWSPRGSNSQVWAGDGGALRERPHKLLGKSQCFPSPAPPPAGWDRTGGCCSPKQRAVRSWSSRQPCPEPLCSPQL